MTCFLLQPTYHSFLNIPDPVGGVIVPQKVHVPPQAGAFTPGETIRFSHNGEPGVRMVTVLTSCRECGEECTGLEGGDTISPIAVEGNKISIRLNVRYIIFITVHTITHNVLFFVVAWMSIVGRSSQCSDGARWANVHGHQVEARPGCR